MVHAQDPQQVVAIEEGRGTHRVEAFLDHRRPHRRTKRVVGVVDSEQGCPGGHRGGRQRRAGEVADGPDVGGREAP